MSANKGIQLLVVILAFLLAGCAATPEVLKELKPTVSAKSFILQAALQVNQKNGLAYGLAPGEYVAVAENQHGTLYRGPGMCVLYQHTQGYMIRSGGVWVPSQGGSLMLYGYGQQGVANFGDAASARAAQRASLSGLNAEGRGGKVQMDMATRLAVEQVATSNASPIQAGVGSAIGWTLVEAMAASDLAKERGMPILLYAIENPEIRQAIALGQQPPAGRSR